MDSMYKELNLEIVTLDELIKNSDKIIKMDWK